MRVSRMGMKYLADPPRLSRGISGELLDGRAPGRAPPSQLGLRQLDLTCRDHKDGGLGASGSTPVSRQHLRIKSGDGDPGDTMLIDERWLPLRPAFLAGAADGSGTHWSAS